MHSQTHTTFRTTLFATFSLAALLLLAACGGGGGSGGGGAGVVGLSQHGSTNSHNGGTDCLSCHSPGNSGTGNFATAGTASGSSGETVRFYSDSSRNNLVAKLEIDAYGNFYTVTEIDELVYNPTLGYTPGVYVSITNGSNERDMPGIITDNPSCNFCHSGPGTQSPL